MQVIRGKVQHGDGRGKTLGVPTVNINIHQPIRDGIFSASAKVKDAWYDGVAFIGPALTFQQKKRWLEVHLFHFNQNCYGQYVTIRLHQKIRSNKKFTTAASLKQVMKKDIEVAKNYFKRHSCSQA